MTRTHLFLYVLTSTLVLGSCNKDEPTGAEPAEAASLAGMTREQVGEKSSALWSKMRTIIESADGDCAKMATEIRGVVSEFQPLFKAADTFVLDEIRAEKGDQFIDDPDNKREFAEANNRQIRVLLADMTRDMDACESDPEVQKAFASLERSGE